MKRFAIVAAAIAAFLMPAGTARADEGMWLPCLISQRIDDMQAKGFRLSAEDVYSINRACLKDAVVLFGGGCTGEVVSRDGLLFTNHHCGYGCIQRHSSVEHDYLRDGFWALTRDEELPNPGMTVSFLDRMQDVTAIVTKDCREGMGAKERNAAISKAIKALEAEAVKDGAGLRARVEALYHANQYYLFVYRVYRDIRLVGAPPSSIGKFGGDTDNWMWPRHTGDFSIFRIYADKDGNPADYSGDNVPYTPKKYFKISRKGVQEGDFTMVFGFPGTTKEYVHSAEVAYVQNVSDPMKVAIRTQRLDIQKKYMSADQKVRIQYSSKNASIANGWKKWMGEMGGLKRNGIVERKKAYEAGLESWAAGGPYEGITGRIQKAIDDNAGKRFLYELAQETLMAFELGNFSNSVVGALRKSGSAPASGDFYKNWNENIDKECLVVEISEFAARVPDGSAPQYFTDMMARHGSAQAWADCMFANTIFTDPARVEALTKDDVKALEEDPVYQFAAAVSKWFGEKVQPESRKYNAAVNPLMESYMKAQMEYEPARASAAGTAPKTFYPDANLTLRVAYGKVEGYAPYDGAYYYPVSTLKGIMEKDNPDVFDYNIPQVLRDIYASGVGRSNWKGGESGSAESGRYAQTGSNSRNGSGQQGSNVYASQPVCFLATNHTTGGNSGSPVINADGNLIGINFDRVWEGTMSDLAFDPSYCRNISLDIRYLLFVIEQVGGAKNIISELEFAD